MSESSPVRTVSILGVGLMGASLAGALKKIPAPPFIRGSTPNLHEGEKALKKGLLDEYFPENRQAVEGADWIVIAAPPSVIPSIWEEIAPAVSPNTLMTDLASVKLPLYRQFRERFARTFINYVSSHPMAGRELHGVDAARPDLFRDRLTFLIPFSDPGHETGRDMERFVSFWKSAGCGTHTILDAMEHDRILARISHLPHAISFALLGTLTQNYRERLPHWNWPAQRGGALADLLRISWSSPTLWADILIQNKDAVTETLEDYGRELDELRKHIENGETERLAQLLSAWQEKGQDDIRYGQL